jgi:hypothetical protein
MRPLGDLGAGQVGCHGNRGVRNLGEFAGEGAISKAGLGTLEIGV